MPPSQRRSWIIATITTVALSAAACSATNGVSSTGGGGRTTGDNDKPRVDNHSYQRTGALPLPTTTPDAQARDGNPMPEVTVTVTATPTMDAATEQPQVLEIPAFDVASDVVPVGKDAEGGVAVPEDVRQTGWYDRSSWIGAPEGSIVLVGHRDSAVAGAGALFGIEQLEMGDTIVLSAQDGTPHRFRVREIRSVEKTRFSSIVDDVFDPQSPYRLTLITCGGDFDYSAGSYLSNIIVTAYPQ